MHVSPSGHGLGYRRNPNRPGMMPLHLCRPDLLMDTAPPTVDLRAKFLLPVPDQGQFGTCTANAAAAMFEYELLRQGVPVPHRKSRAFNYYCAGSREGDTSDDGRDPFYTFLSLHLDGLCDETYWSYTPDHILGHPTLASYTAAAHRHALAYYTVTADVADVKSALASGFSVAIGILVYESFEGQQAASTGVVPLPGPNDRMLGGHMLAIVGYSDVQHGNCPPGHLIVRNSWGDGFGDAGHVYLPYSYLTTQMGGQPLTMDLIALEVVTGPAPHGAP